MKTRTALWIQVSVGFILPCTIQIGAFFANNWIVDENDVSKGLFYQCTGKTKWGPSGCSMHLLDQATIGVEGTATILITFACVYSVLSVLLYGPDTYDDIDNDESLCYILNCVGFYCCSIALYPITGILILSGCIRFGTLYPTELLGGAFYLSAMTGCLQFVLLFVSCCDAICKRKSEEFVFKTLTERLYEDAM